MNNFSGWLNIYKPLNISSFQVVNKIKRKFKLKKIGHTGTLDPLAEGILPVAVGKTTKLSSLINNSKKEYEFEIKWGEQTLTDDREGKIIDISKKIPTEKEIKMNLDKFKGLILQTPPKASANKINGIRAYKLLRTNKSFQTKEKLVEVFEIKFIEQTSYNITKLKIICGKGFYIRSLARDLGEQMNTKGHVYSLKRTKVGKFHQKNSILLDDLLKISQMDFGIKGYHSSISMLDDILAFEIDKKMLDDIYHGKIIKINNDFSTPLILNEHQFCLLVNNNEIVSLGILDGDYFKPKKVFKEEVRCR